MDDDDQINGGNLFSSLPIPGRALNTVLTKPDWNWTLNSCTGWSKDRPTSRIIGYRDAASLIFQRLAEDRGRSLYAWSPAGVPLATRDRTAAEEHR